MDKARYAKGRYALGESSTLRRMFSYAERIPAEDRWAIIAYIRALQLSQNATLSDLPEPASTSLPDTVPIVAPGRRRLQPTTGARLDTS